jgi:hypothetical protein
MNAGDESTQSEPRAARRLPALQEGALPTVWTGSVERYGSLLRAIDVHEATCDRLLSEERPDLALTSWGHATAICAELCLQPNKRIGSQRDQSGY